MDGFEEPYWNLIQTLAWVYLRDRALVRLASDGVTDHGTFPKKMRLPDGRKELVETPANPPNDLHLELTAAFACGAAYQTLDDAEDALLDVLCNGRLNAWGLENNKGDLQEISPVQWAVLRFYFDPPRAAPLSISRSGATHWHGMKFATADVMRLWPDPLEGSVVETIDTRPAEKPGKAQAQPQRLETEHQRKGGRVSKYHRGVQEFVDRLSDKFARDGQSLTLGRLESWLTENAPKDDGIDPQPEIPDFDDVEYYEETLWWKDAQSQFHSIKKRPLERYIARAKSRDRGSLS